MTFRQAVKKLDRELSKLIRTHEKKCFTCGGKNDHAGHFVRRGAMSMRFDPRNLHSQCIRDNLFFSGELGVYAINLDKKYGTGTAEKLIKLGRKIKKWETRELETLIEATKAGYEEYIKVYQEIYP